MKTSCENGLVRIEFYLDDLTDEAQKELIGALGGDNGNYDVIPFATIEIEPDSEIPCPLGGDTSNGCAGCAYSGDYEFKDGECTERSDEDVEQLPITDLSETADV